MNPHCTRRDFLKTSAAAAGLGAVPRLNISTAKEKAKGRPNILIILADQMNIDAISAYQEHFGHPAWGCRWVRTPNLDRMVLQGTSFLLSHSTNPVCSPARSSIFTGRMTTETGVIQNNIGIDQNVPNMGQWFERHSDYTRVYCGKWHAGGLWSYPEVDGNRKIPGFSILPAGNGNTGDTIDYMVSGSASAFVRNYSSDKPFLLVAGLMNPHDICYWIPALCGDTVTPHADEFNLGDQRPILPPNHDALFNAPLPIGRVDNFNESRWRNYMYDYYRMVEKLDADVGRLLRAAESRRDDTIVVFTSDHGEGCGRHGCVQKWHPFDQSVKVPLIVHCPGRIRESAIDDTHLVSGVDILSTLCDYAGIPAPPQTCGLSLRPLLSDSGPQSWRDSLFIEFRHTGRVLRTRQYKYVMAYEFSKDKESPFVRKKDGSASIFEPGKTDLYQVKSGGLLFDMQNDPWEMKNLYDDSLYASVIEEHEKLLRQWESRLIPGVHFDRN